MTAKGWGKKDGKILQTRYFDSVMRSEGSCSSVRFKEVWMDAMTLSFERG